jgi:putative inorganic carbon (hco3(-)) transporter
MGALLALTYYAEAPWRPKACQRVLFTQPRIGLRRLHRPMSFFLFILYIVFTYLRPFDTFAVDLASFRPMLILWLIAFIAAGTRALSRGEVAGRPVHFWLLAMLVATIGLSQVANQWAGGALPAIMEFSTAAMLMVLCMLNLTTLRRLQATCLVIVCCVVLLAGLGIYSFHTGYMAEELVLRQNTADDVESDPYYDDIEFKAPADDKSGNYLLRVRSLGFLNDPNDFAQTMVMVLPLLWWLYVPGRWFRNLLVVVAPGLVLGYGIVLTQSRGAMLGIGAILLLAAHRMLGLTRTLLIMAPLVATVGLVSLGGRELSTKEQSAAQRVEAWQEGLIMLRTKPSLGVGFGNFTDHHYLTAHNSFVLCFAELGLIGYFAWMALIVLTFKGLQQGLRLAPIGSPERRMTDTLRAALVAYLACAWFLSRTYSPGLFVLLALCVAAWYSVREIHGPPPQSRDQEVVVWGKATLVAMFVSIATVYAFVLVQRSSG